jgi:hypothetical protein
MSAQRSYLAAAFNARPFGMPVAPNWFAIVALALLGAFVSPGFWLIGAGLEGLYLWALSNNKRFRALVDAENGTSGWNARYESIATHLDSKARQTQQEIELQVDEIVDLLSRSQTTELQIGYVRQMAWLHLKLLAARSAFAEVIVAAGREREAIEEQQRRTETRLQEPGISDELRRSLEQQLTLIHSRRGAHADAERRRELVDAELERLRQQVSLVREQALLATDENSAAQSLDALSASLNEANRWLQDQRELFVGLNLDDEPPPAELWQPEARAARRQRASE